MDPITSQITSLTIVYSTVHSALNLYETRILTSDVILAKISNLENEEGIVSNEIPNIWLMSLYYHA